MVDPGLDLLTVIQSQRPRWLRTRDRTFASATTVAVMMDGMRAPGGAGALRSIRAAEVEEAYFLSPADATTRFGTDMAGGAIVVVRRR